MTESTLILTVNLNTDKIGSVGNVTNNTVLKVINKLVSGCNFYQVYLI